MVNINKLRGKIVECGKTVEEVAEQVGIDKSTLYRRICGGGGTFTINEADKIASVLQLSAKELNEIFFAQYVAQYANVNEKAALNVGVASFFGETRLPSTENVS